MLARQNPVDDKVRSARKRYGDRAALWGLLTALYATGRDDEANRLVDDFRLGKSSPSETLEKGLSLPELGRSGEILVGWAAHRYQIAYSSGERAVHRVMSLLPQAAYSVMEWTQRARPRPNLFDYSVESAYAEAKRFLEGKEARPVKQGTVVFRFDDGWTVQDLNTKALLVDEGNHQHICVGQERHGYPERVADGEIKIYSLRDRDGRPHVTMTWSQEEGLFEVSGKNNDNIFLDDLRARLRTFALSLGMSKAKAKAKFGPLCRKARAIADSFDADALVNSISNVFHYRLFPNGNNYDFRDEFIEHPVMDVTEFRKRRGEKQGLWMIAKELAKKKEEETGVPAEQVKDAFYEGLHYLETVCVDADDVGRTLKLIAEMICAGDDPSEKLSDLISMEHMSWGEECRQTQQMNELIAFD